MDRTDWAELSEPVRHAITAYTGPVLSAETAADGLTSALAMSVRTSTNTIFVKGLRTDHPGVVTQHREAMINPHVLSVSPRLRWHIDGVDGSGRSRAPTCRSNKPRSGGRTMSTTRWTWSAFAATPCCTPITIPSTF